MISYKEYLMNFGYISHTSTMSEDEAKELFKEIQNQMLDTTED